MQTSNLILMSSFAICQHELRNVCNEVLQHYLMYLIYKNRRSTETYFLFKSTFKMLPIDHFAILLVFMANKSFFVVAFAFTGLFSLVHKCQRKSKENFLISNILITDIIWVFIDAQSLNLLCSSKSFHTIR